MLSAIRILLVAIALSSVASAQLRLPKDTLDWPTPVNVVSLNAAGLAVDYFSVLFMHALDSSNALGAVANFVYRPLGGFLPRGYGGGIVYRYYPATQALWRFHYSAQVTFLRAWLTGSPDTAASGVGVGASVGWQWFPVRGFAVGFSIGEGYLRPFSAIDNEALERVFGLRPILSFDLGVAW